MADGLFAAVLDASAVWAALLDTFHGVEAWATAGYARAPVLMAGLIVVAVVPPLALIGHLAAGISSFLRPGRRPAPAAPGATAMTLGWPRDAWIVLDDTSADTARRPLHREMLSFGREDDNDVRLEHATVHRHHAVLHRTPEAHFIIRDLSGPRGNGVKVNGQRVSERSLEDGDRIEIGAVRIKFEAQFA